MLNSGKILRPLVAAATMTAWVGMTPAQARAQDAPAPEPVVKLSASYTADVIGVVDGGAARPSTPMCSTISAAIPTTWPVRCRVSTISRSPTSG
jgi:hypothetical protein